MMTHAREGRLLPVLHVLHLEEHEGRSSSSSSSSCARRGRLYLRPNFFANTPDILHEYLQQGGRPAFEARLVLAATLSPSYGIYSGYEHFENVPVRAGSEEYLDSEKYELKRARARRAAAAAGPAAERDPARAPRAPAPRATSRCSRRRASTSSPTRSALGDDVVLVVVNLDPFAAHEGVVRRPAGRSGCREPFAVVDLLDRRDATTGGSAATTSASAPARPTCSRCSGERRGRRPSMGSTVARRRCRQRGSCDREAGAFRDLPPP